MNAGTDSLTSSVGEVIPIAGVGRVGGSGRGGLVVDKAFRAEFLGIRVSRRVVMYQPAQKVIESAFQSSFAFVSSLLPPRIQQETKGKLYLTYQ